MLAVQIIEHARENQLQARMQAEILKSDICKCNFDFIVVVVVEIYLFKLFLLI
jgi:hypothetical protein